jgi:hypothetical protein
MNRIKKAVVLSAAVLLALSTLSLTMLLEKKIYYIAYGKISECSYWTVFFGNHPVKLTRTFPGEEPVEIEVDMNFSLISSGYMEGWGQTERGRIECDPVLMIKTEKGEKEIELKDIAAVFDSGEKVKTVDGTVGELLIGAEGNRIAPYKIILRYYSHFDDQGEAVLSHEDDYPIVAFAFNKAEMQEMLKRIKE